MWDRSSQWSEALEYSKALKWSEGSKRSSALKRSQTLMWSRALRWRTCVEPRLKGTDFKRHGRTRCELCVRCEAQHMSEGKYWIWVGSWSGANHGTDLHHWCGVEHCVEEYVEPIMEETNLNKTWPHSMWALRSKWGWVFEWREVLKSSEGLGWSKAWKWSQSLMCSRPIRRPCMDIYVSISSAYMYVINMCNDCP